MRHYAPDSPQAVARILALALLADGALDVAEMRALGAHDLQTRFNIDGVLFDEVVKDFCFDLAQYGDRSYGTHLELDRETLAQLLRDIRSPQLQLALMRVIVDVVNADQVLADGEALLLAEAMVVWGLDLHQLGGAGALRSVLPRKFGRRAGDAHGQAARR